MKKLLAIIIGSAVLVVLALTFKGGAQPLIYTAASANALNSEVTLATTADSLAALVSYRQGIEQISRTWPQQSAKDLMAAVLKTSQTHNADDLFTVLEAKKDYQQTTKDLARLAVPARLLPLEQNFMKALLEITETTEQMAQAVENPSLALAAAQAYPTKLKELQQAVNAVGAGLGQLP